MKKLPKNSVKIDEITYTFKDTLRDVDGNEIQIDSSGQETWNNVVEAADLYELLGIPKPRKKNK